MNLIDFKIKSSLSKLYFFHSYNFYLNSIEKEVEFNEEDKNIIILQYDSWFFWLSQIEEYLLNEKKISFGAISKKFIQNYNKLKHNELEVDLKNKIILLINDLDERQCTNAQAFEYIAKWLSLYIQSLIYLIYELRMIKSNPFIAVTDFYLQRDSNNFEFLLERAVKYKKEFNIKEFKIFNYTSNNDITDNCKALFNDLDFKISVI